MRKIRIGNDIQVSWEVKTGGEALSLEGRSLRVWVRSAYSRQEIESFGVDGCVLTFTYPAGMQKTTGARAVVLEDMTEGSARRTLCADEAFTLVAHSSEEDCCGCGDISEEDFGKYLVSLKSNILVGKPGLSAYDLWLKDGHTGTTEDYMKWLQQPAADAASAVMAAEEKRVAAESGRMEAERLRDDAEAERNTNEAGRTAAETERQKLFTEKMNALGDKEQEVDTAVSEMKTDVGNAISEAERKTDAAVKSVTDAESAAIEAENLRANAEAERKTAETLRNNEETARKTAESGRVDAETLRGDAETARNASEADRIKSEKERNESENLRAKTESDRQTAEADRINAEQSRAAAETERAEAERLRTEAEKQRAESEQTRGDSFAKQTETMNTALRNCETATEGAEKVDATLSDANVLTVTDRDGTAKSVDLASQEDVAGIVDDVQHLNETMGAYTERESITLTAVETNKAVSADGVKVTKQGWAIAEFTAELGNEYLFKPGVTDGSVCIFAECIDKTETRAIEYQSTYDEKGRVATATATYNGKTYTYAYAYDDNGTAVITDQDGVKKSSLPSVYTTTVGAYQPLTRLNDDAELPKDGYCRFVSNFQVAAAIKVAVSYKVGAADLVMKVVRDGMTASMCTQLSKINRKVDETAAKVPKMWIKLMTTKRIQISLNGKRVTLEPKKVYKFNDPTSISFYLYDADNMCVSRDISLMEFHYNDFAPMKSFVLGDNIGGLLSKIKLDLTMLDTSGMKSMERFFVGYKNRELPGVESLDTSNVTNMCFIFNLTAIETLDLRNWDTRKVRDMRNFCCGYYDGYNYQSTKYLYAQGWDFSSIVYPIGFYQNGTMTDLYIGEGWGKIPGTGKTLDFSSLVGWKNGIETLLDLYDRRGNGLPDLTLKLPAQAKTKIGEEGLATLTAKGYIIA